MKPFITSSILAMLMAAMATPALAQTPRTDSAAVGADVGVFLPRADFLKSGGDFFVRHRRLHSSEDDPFTRRRLPVSASLSLLGFRFKLFKARWGWYS